MAAEQEYAYFNRVISLGRERVDQNFDRTFAQLDEARQHAQSAEQLQRLDAVVEAYRLARELTMSAFQLRELQSAQRVTQRP